MLTLCNYKVNKMLIGVSVRKRVGFVNLFFKIASVLLLLLKFGWNRHIIASEISAYPTTERVSIAQGA